MGSVVTKERMGQRVLEARLKLQKCQNEEMSVLKTIQKATPNISSLIMNCMESSLKQYAPFPDKTLLWAWHSNPRECQRIIHECCSRVLKQPVNKQEFQWFRDNMLNCPIWFFKTDEGKFMYEHLIEIATKSNAISWESLIKWSY